jgi:phytoene dehydrogenase-like protein
MHAAVQLTSTGKSVVVVERNKFIGGGTHTYIDPITSATVDIGVVIFQPIPDVHEIFQKLDVPLLNKPTVKVNKPGDPPNPGVPAAMFQTNRKDADFRDGSEVIRNLPSGEAEALARFADVLSKYSYVLDGYEFPDPVPEDLYLVSFR